MSTSINFRADQGTDSPPNIHIKDVSRAQFGSIVICSSCRWRIQFALPAGKMLVAKGSHLLYNSNINFSFFSWSSWSDSTVVGSMNNGVASLLTSWYAWNQYLKVQDCNLRPDILPWTLVADPRDRGKGPILSHGGHYLVPSHLEVWSLHREGQCRHSTYQLDYKLIASSNMAYFIRGCSFAVRTKFWLCIAKSLKLCHNLIT